MKKIKDKKLVESFRLGRKIGEFDVALFATSNFHLFFEGLVQRSWIKKLNSVSKVEIKRLWTLSQPLFLH
ncbi:hypothetical protein [Carnobacterium maltaromaticum]|uniref:hypothetical protein n=2 Tax=Carnobacterium TaxID=2747 RepID=UPI00026C873D|nr:hypothetical protein [Carnobacterium maltaromaticum]AOA01606.1 hypothetical protein BFC23_03490 [Carnobacterium maltaromaticum]MCC4311722.1 hypothetical protein [Carnobacterium maltaromaticum]